MREECDSSREQRGKWWEMMHGSDDGRTLQTLRILEFILGTKKSQFFRQPG